MSELRSLADRYLTELQDAGCAGWVGLEHKPTTSTDDSLDWLPRERRASASSGHDASST